MSEPPEREPVKPGARWPAFFQMAAEPLFLLDRRRKLRFVNRAWEKLTGYAADEALGWGCSGRRDDDTSPVAVAMRPPREVLDGQPSRVRRAVPPSRAGPPWWDIAYFPIRGENGVLGILGRITPVGPPAAARGKPLAETLMALRFEHAKHFPLEWLQSDAPVGERLAAQVRLACSHRAWIWLRGEPGSGKYTLARLIHHHGPTREKTFALVDCSSLPPPLLAGILFAPGGLMRSPAVGAVYLREPGKLARDLQERIADRPDELPRLIVGSAKSPEECLRDGEILPEFFAAVGVTEIAVPPLRDRVEDLPQFASRLIDRLSAAGLSASGGVAPEVTELFRAHGWPGNLRELEGVLQSAIESADGVRMEVAHLPLAFRAAATAGRRGPPLPGVAPPFLALELILEQVERKLVTRALAKAKGNRTEAAELLGVTRTELWRRIKALKIEDA